MKPARGHQATPFSSNRASPGTKQELQDVCIGHGNDSRRRPAGSPDHLAQEDALEAAACGRALRLARPPTFRQPARLFSSRPQHPTFPHPLRGVGNQLRAECWA